MIVASNVQRSSRIGASYHLYGQIYYTALYILVNDCFIPYHQGPPRDIREQGKWVFISGNQGNKCQLLRGIGEQRQY